MTGVMFRDILKGMTFSHETDPCQTCESRHLGFFCNSDESTLAVVNEAKSFRHFEAGDPVFQNGDVPDGIYCLKKGAVKIEAMGENGQAHILHIVNAGGILGLRAALDGGVFEASAVAIQPTDLCFIPNTTFTRLLAKDPTIALSALRSVALELNAMEKRFCHATDLTATERIAAALLHLKDRFESQQWSRREFAEWASTTTETVIRTLAQFEKDGLIRLAGRKISILDRRRLLERARIYI